MKREPGTDDVSVTPRPQVWVWVSVVFVTALALRVSWIANMDTWDAKGIDVGITVGDCYHCIATRILEHGFGEGFGPPSKPLGFPVFLAGMYKLFGQNFLLVRLVQAVLDSLSCLIIMQIGILLFGRRTGILAGMLAAGYPFFIREAARFGAETLFMLLFLTSMFFVLRASRGQRTSDMAWGGLFLGLSTLVKPAPIVLIPLVVGFLGVVLRPRAKQLLVLVFAFCVLPPLLSVPWGLRNFSMGYGFVTTETLGGLTFYMGNSELTEIIFTEGKLSEEIRRGLKPYPSSHHYDKAFQFIRENPGTYVKLLALKVGEFWRMFPLENRDIFGITAHSLIPPLGLAGLFLGWRRRTRETVFLVLMMLNLTVFFTIYMTELRYRVPLADPFLLVYASLLILAVAGRVSGKLGPDLNHVRTE